MDKTRPGDRAYEELYRKLEELLEAEEGGQSAASGFARQIAILQVKLGELRELAADGFGDVASEVVFFRGVWPRFYRMHRDFWVYYRAGSAVIDPQFTRAFSKGCVFDPVCWVIDPEGATLASWKAAWGLALEEYAGFLQRVRERAADPAVDRWEWKETRSAAVELLKAMAEAGSVHVNGKPATTRQLRTLFEQRFGMEINDFDNLLYATDIRKIDATPYFTKLKEAFVARRERLGK